MKRAISALLVSLVVFSTAQARPMTDTELIWSFVGSLSPANSEDKGASALSQLKNTDLSDGAIQRLRSYSIDANKQLEDLAKQSYGELCALKGGSRAAIADQLTKMHVELRALEENLMENIGVVLSDEEQRILYKLVMSDMSSSGEVGGEDGVQDMAYGIRTGMVDVDEYMEQICPASATEPAAPASTAQVPSE